jgi:hypothetical protein
VSGYQQVHIRVTDAATGKPTPCRIRITDAEGIYYAPFGRLADFGIAPTVFVGGNLQISSFADVGPKVSEKHAYIDGGCEIALPPGLIDVAISKGSEYTPLRQQVQLAAGKLALRFVLERWSDIRRNAWYSGDIRVHFMTPSAAVLDGAGEDLSVVNVLARITALPSIGFANLLDFSGKQPALERDGTVVVVNTYNTHPRLGSLALLNCHRVVYPLGFGASPLGVPFENWTLSDWCDQCHRKHGLVVWSATGFPAVIREYGEALADLILGKIDAFEVERFDCHDQNPWPEIWYELLNTGFRVPLVGGSGKDSNSVPVGRVRTYARLQPDQPFTYTNWIEAIRAGRTVATNGPLLTMTANGEDPGATIQIAAGQCVRVLAEASCIEPFEHLEVVVNGAVVAEQSASGSPATARIEAEIEVPEGGWVAARCHGKGWLPDSSLGQRVAAHTSPIYVRVDGRWAPVDGDAARRLLSYLSGTLAWAETQGRYQNDAQRKRLCQVFIDAKKVLHGKLQV